MTDQPDPGTIDAAATDGVAAGDVIPPDGSADTRAARWRARAEAASIRYEEAAVRQPVFGLPIAFIARYTARQGMLLASAVAFRLFLWLLPLALLSAGLLAAVSRGHTQSLESASKSAGLTGAASQQMVTALSEGSRSWPVAVATGLVLFLWGSRTLMRNLVVVNAHAWGVPVPKTTQKEVMKTTLKFAGGVIGILLAGTLISKIDHEFVGGPLVALGLEAAVVGAIWMVLVLRLPDRRTDWLDLVPGSVLFGLGLAVMHVVSRVYLPQRFAHSSQVYGSLGIASVMLAWLLILGQIVVGSAMANVVWCDFRAGGAAPSTPAVPPPAPPASPTEAGAQP